MNPPESVAAPYRGIRIVGAAALLLCGGARIAAQATGEREIAPGECRTGTIMPGDRAQAWRFRPRAAGICTVELTSVDFDAAIAIEDASGNRLAETGGGWVATDARLSFEAKTESERRILVVSEDGVPGAYDLHLHTGAPRDDERSIHADRAIRAAREQTGAQVPAGGDANPRTWHAFERLALLLHQSGRFAQAEPPLMRALVVIDDDDGAEPLDRARLLANLAGLRHSTGRRAAAVAPYTEALALYESHAPPDSPFIAGILQNLGYLHAAEHRRGEAEACFRRLCRHLEAHAPADLAARSGARCGLAGAVASQGRIAEARTLVDEAMGLAEASGSEAARIQALREAGTLSWMDARPAEAEARLREALDLIERRGDGEALDTAVVLDNLVAVTRESHRFSEAVAWGERALRLRRQALGEDHQNTAFTTSQLAFLKSLAGHPREAREMWERVLPALRSETGELHVPGTIALWRYGTLLRDLGEEAQASRILADAARRAASALRQLKDLWPAEVFALTRCLEGTASRGELLAAFQKLEVALLDTLPPDHPLLADTRFRMGALHLHAGRRKEALALQAPATAAARDRIAHGFRALSEDERLDVSARWRSSLDFLVTAAADAGSGAGAASVYGEVLAWKGLVARGLLQERAWLLKNADSGTLGRIEALRAVLSRLSGETRGLSDGAGHPAQIRRLIEERNRLERELASGTGTFGAPEPPAVDAVKGALAGDEAVVDFLVWSRRTPRSPVRDDLPPLFSSEDRVLAFVVRRDRPVAAMDLGPARAIENAVAAHLTVIPRRTAAKAGRGPPADEERWSRALRDRVWRPLVPHLDGVFRVFVVPDGILATLPFETISGEEPGTFLVEKRAFVVLQGASELLATREPPGSAGGVLLVGGIDYGPAEAEAEAATAGGHPGRERPRFDPLPATRDEVEELAAGFRGRGGGADGDVLVLGGKAATKAAIAAAVKGRSWIHLATHGFVAASPGGTAGPASGGRGLLARDLDLEPSARFLPGLLSGIALSGANAGPGPAGGEDGILTAGEAIWLDLSACEILCLSACDSGLGKVVSGEHLLGLRRSLRLAGARATVTSLWKVGDAAARTFMSGFYRRLWSEGLPKGEALRQTQLEILRRSRETTGGDGLPGLWGAFILEGAWR